MSEPLAAPAPAEPKPAARPKEPSTTHRADAAQAFMANWLPGHAVSADAFTAADAEALVDAIDRGAKASG